MKKFDLTGNTISHKGRILHQIICVESFDDVKYGVLGGWIEKEENLSHDGKCWVYDDAKVYDDANISDDAKLYDKSEVYNNAIVYGNATIYNHAKVSGNAKVYGLPKIFDWARIHENAIIYNKAQVFGYGVVSGYARVYGDAIVCGRATITGHASVHGSAQVHDDVLVWQFADIRGNANLINHVKVDGNATIEGDAVIANSNDFIVFRNWWSSLRYFTWTRSNNMWSVGCFHGTGAQLIRKAYDDDEDCGRNYEKIVSYVNSILQSENKKTGKLKTSAYEDFI